MLPFTKTDEGIVFIYKTSGDFMRYITEYSKRSEKTQNATKTLKFYYQADQVARELLPSTHPYRLGLNLNLAVFFVEIMKNYEKAYNLAKQAFDEANDEMD